MTSPAIAVGAYKKGGSATKAIKLFCIRKSVVWRRPKKKKKKSLGRHCKERGNGDGEGRHQKGPLDRAGRHPTGLNRTGKSCRLRWVNYLHPGLKRGRMTPQEEHLVLELHAKWGNRWSRIARRLPGRTDNEIKNYWRTHMRKKAQERKRSSSSPSPSSSSSNLSSSLSDPPLEVGVEKHEGDGARVEGTSSLMTGLEEDGEAVPKSYPMEQIWNDIATPELVGDLSFEGYKDIEAGNFSCPAPVTSPMWDYSSDSLWKIDDEEYKMFAPIADDTIRES